MPGTGTELLRTPRASGAPPWGAGSPATLREGLGRELVPGLAEGKHTLESPLVHRLCLHKPTSFPGELPQVPETEGCPPCG